MADLRTEYLELFFIGPLKSSRLTRFPRTGFFDNQFHNLNQFSHRGTQDYIEKENYYQLANRSNQICFLLQSKNSSLAQFETGLDDQNQTTKQINTIGPKIYRPIPYLSQASVPNKSLYLVLWIRSAYPACLVLFQKTVK